MSAIEQALERGRQTKVRRPQWEPVAVTHGGRLTARFRSVSDGEEVAVLSDPSGWIYTGYGFNADGEAVVQHVKDRELVKRAKAMLADPSDDLIREAMQARRDRAANGGGRSRRLRRKS